MPVMPDNSPIITLLTDFGSQDAFVGIMKGVMLSITPSVQFVDLSHEIPAQNILAGALILHSAVHFFPPTTIHTAVVDPGVGSDRKGIVVETGHGIFVGPDNGLLSLAAPAESVQRITHVTNAAYFLDCPSPTFHGRDVFAPVAAHLAQGVGPTQLGPRLSSLERVGLPVPVHTPERITGSVLYIDHFGNAITNITPADLLPFSTQQLWVSINAQRIGRVETTYAAVAEGEAVAVINSWQQVEIAIRNGSAARAFKIEPGCRVEMTVV